MSDLTLMRIFVKCTHFVRRARWRYSKECKPSIRQPPVENASERCDARQRQERRNPAPFRQNPQNFEPGGITLYSPFIGHMRMNLRIEFFIGSWGRHFKNLR